MAAVQEGTGEECMQGVDETTHLGKGGMLVGGEGELASGHSAALEYLASLTW